MLVLALVVVLALVLVLALVFVLVFVLVLVLVFVRVCAGASCIVPVRYARGARRDRVYAVPKMRVSE